jgi:hypothetical protein
MPRFASLGHGSTLAADAAQRQLADSMNLRSGEESDFVDAPAEYAEADDDKFDGPADNENSAERESAFDKVPAPGTPMRQETALSKYVKTATSRAPTTTAATLATDESASATPSTEDVSASSDRDTWAIPDVVESAAPSATTDGASQQRFRSTTAATTTVTDTAKWAAPGIVEDAPVPTRTSAAVTSVANSAPMTMAASSSSSSSSSLSSSAASPPQSEEVRIPDGMVEDSFVEVPNEAYLSLPTKR